jgi:predicted RNA-binding protein YlqC (UPF0109 family)
MSSIDQQFIEFIVKSLVSKPEAVQIERRIDEKGVLLELTVDPEDLGRVIGRRGATAQSLRTLLRALGTKNDARYNLKVVDNGEQAPASSAAPQNDGGDDDQPVNGGAADDEEPAKVADEDTADEDKEKRGASSGTNNSEGLASKTRKELADLDDLDV